MKNLITALALLLFGFAILSGCKKEDKEPEKIYQSSLVNPTLTELQSFYEEGYNVIAGNVEFDDIDGLVNMNTLSNVRQINGSFIIEDNQDLISFSGLSNLETIGEDFEIDNNNDLDNFAGLNNLKSVGGWIEIYSNDDLSSLAGLNGLVSVGGSFDIENNYYLSSISDLSSLKTIGYTFILWGSYVESLSGLENLQKANRLEFVSNIKLNDFCSVKSFMTNNVDSISVSIYDNKYNPTVEDIIAGNCTISDIDVTLYLSNYPELNNLGGWVYYASVDPPSRGLIIYRMTEEIFNAYERMPPSNPNLCCNLNSGICTALIVDEYYPFVYDTCSNLSYQILDGSPISPATVPLVEYQTSYFNGVLYINN